jgi:hypothetical protein
MKSEEDKKLDEFNQRQIDAMNYHKYMLGTRLGRSPTSLEACVSWIEEGFAKRFRSGEFDSNTKKEK